MTIEEDKAKQFQELVSSRIENLRPKLLDLSRRNPLISTRFSTRSSSLVRVVDELPDVIAYNLRHQQAMRLIPLPPLDGDPQDEKSEDFQQALSSARLTDEIYLSALDQIEDEDVDSLESAERELKDRLRIDLGMAPRQQKGELSHSQHAINNGISPNYELPLPDNEHEDGRHTDENIQTLFLPEDLERKLNGLFGKCSTWEQETGINVLHVAFGFLEWFEPNNTQSFFAPLVLLPVKIEKRKTREGLEFWINADGDDAEENFVFAEMLRREFGIPLPRFNKAESVEKYFAEVAEFAPSNLKWRVRRQVAVGVFPSARMAMYADLDTKAHAFINNTVITDLFCGSTADVDTPFADEYDVDTPSIEAKVPCLVMDADSSQFSTIVDISEGKNLAVEGPPGTGKSQTIVNTIAAAMAQGKKVLFVAEKMAALEVVKSRLEAVGLGKFILPLQAKRSTREQVVSSIRSRLEMPHLYSPQEYEAKVNKFRQVRDELAAYINIISSAFGSTGLKIYDILGKNILNNDLLTSLPQSLTDTPIQEIESFDYSKRVTINSKATLLEKTWQEVAQAKTYWQGLTSSRIDRFAISEILKQADFVAQTSSQYGDALVAAYGIGIEKEIAIKEMHNLYDRLCEIENTVSILNIEYILNVIKTSSIEAMDAFYSDCKKFQSIKNRISNVINSAAFTEPIKNLIKIKEICNSVSIKTLDASKWQEQVVKGESELAKKQQMLASLNSFANAFPAAKTLPLSTLRQASLLIHSTERDVLAVRSEILADISTSSTLERLCQQGKNLLRHREKIDSILAVNTKAPFEQISEHVSSIKNSGFFSFLSSGYRSAKRYYLSITKRNGFEKETAITDLQTFAAYLAEEDKFNGNLLATALFGKYFDGIETDFDIFLRLCEFYKQVETSFKGIENSGIRALIKFGDYDLVMSLPEIPSDCSIGNIEELEASILEDEVSLFELKEAISKLTELIPIFHKPQQVEVESIGKLADAVEQLTELKKALNENQIASRLLGNEYEGWQTKFERFENEHRVISLILEDANLCPSLLTVVESGNVSQARTMLEKIFSCHKNSLAQLESLKKQSGINFECFYTAEGVKEAAHFFSQAARDPEGLHAHAALASERMEFIALGFCWILDVLEAEKGTLTGLVEIVDALIYQSMARRIYEKHGAILSRYHSTRLDELRAELASLDKEIIHLSRQKLKATLQEFGKKAPWGNGTGRRSEWTQLSLLRNEISKKQRFIPARDLTSRAGQALLDLKPCWMMSPLAVAQYLPQGALTFDLCILDEASQMPPENAIGALARCRQAMVVGDTNQLPPTNFFRKVLEDDEADEDESVLDESILEMANSVFRPARRLRWHYRSRHSGLIQFSNHHVYDDSLVVFPSPSESRSDMGVSFVSVEGSYKAGINRNEASAIVGAIIQFMHTTPGRSLGVVTLNQKQRDLIQEEMERVLIQDPLVAQYIEDWLVRNDGLESFFIKNLENVQGDERDVIFIGTVYGPEKPDGPVMQRFGPINGLAGKRRLNVLLSRAKEQIVTFSSMTATDIKAEEGSNLGAYMLKCWLEYSVTGRQHEGKYEGQEPDSDFEVFVINQLRSMGCEPVPQVGVAGYRIDIGVKHPGWPHGYILGVECDGATYHSSRSARERDRLREEVLTGLGWRLHRIWSTSWFNDPLREAQKLRIAIEKRLQELQRSGPPVIIPKSDDHETDCIEENISTAEFEQESHEPQGSSINEDIVEVGDRVTVRYLDGERSVREVLLSATDDIPEQGTVHISKPLGRALADAELGEEIEILNGNFVRKAIIENIVKLSGENKEQNTSNSLPKRQASPPPERASLKLAHAHLIERTTTESPAKAPLSPEQFYEQSYIPVLQTLSAELVDNIGPITFKHLSESIARAHQFQRTGSQIKKQVWAATSRIRQTSQASNGETIFWPKGTSPVEILTFRGTVINGQERSWQNVPYPERLGLALEILSLRNVTDRVVAMANKIGLGRLHQSTRKELEELLEEAKQRQP